jgi:glycosyltransferase involved in cell wall biosynthesis
MKSDSSILTIAIPSYNRAPRLQAQIERLLPQIQPGVTLQIFDNASTDATRKIVQGYADQGVLYCGADFNCGMGWNFARCIEKSSSEWVWILSDDDPVSETAVADLLQVLRNQTCDFINAFPGVSESEVVVSDLPSFLHHTRFSRLLWISSCIFRTSAFRPLFGVFSEGIFTWAPHVVAVLHLLETRKGNVLLSPLYLFGAPGTPAGWSPLDFLIRISIAPEFLIQPLHQKLLAYDLWSSSVTALLLKGLKETHQPGGIQKWQRIRRQSMANLKSYLGKPTLAYILANSFSSGKRRQTAILVYQLAILRMLAICPGFLFHTFAKFFTLKEV